MSGRALRIVSRVIFVICGLSSLITALPYAMLQGVGLPYQREWLIFVVVLGMLGLFSIARTLARRSWIGKLCKKDPDDRRLFSGPLRVLGLFAVASYLAAVFAYLAPHTWNLNDQIMLALCPMYLLRMTFDPSLALVLFLLAPMNAAVYGSVGLMVAFLWMCVGNGNRENATRIQKSERISSE